ncbi:hypothetical protein N0V82_002208 [Gnomoniopsis sp. IMI 355080]|nr:hypothetical protein N0V82_002208 [Gnomoniopsis sp. IMI 355080]
MTVKIVITKDGTIFQPPTPVRICAWLQSTPRAQPGYLSPTSGRKDDLFWTQTAADQGSLTIVFRLTVKSLNVTSYPKISLVGTAIKIRADLPRSLPEKSSSMNTSVAQTESVRDLHWTKSSPSEDEGSKASILRTLIGQASFHTPIDVITIGVDTLGLAIHLACHISEELWEAFALSQRTRWSRFFFNPSGIVVADDANEIITVNGQDMTTETWTQKCIKANYIDKVLLAEKPLDSAVRLRFQHLDSVGLDDAACGRAWSLIIAADDYTLEESTREATASRIEVVTTSSIWHSAEKASPKLLLRMSGPISENQISLLDMVQSAGWEIVETLERGPIELQPEGPENFNARVRYFLLETRRDTCDYIELVSIGTYGENLSSRSGVVQVVDTCSRRRNDDRTHGDVTRHEMMHGRLGGSQITQPAIQGTNLQMVPSQRSLESIAIRALEKQDQGTVDIQEVLDSQVETDPTVKRRGSPQELDQFEKKRSRTDSSPEEDLSMSDEES